MKTVTTTALIALGLVVGGAAIVPTLTSSQAVAQSSSDNKAIVDAAKARGEVGETYRGLLAARGSVSTEVSNAVREINIGRRDHYRALSRKSGESELDVGKSFAVDLFAKAERGHYLQFEDGGWRQK